MSKIKSAEEFFTQEWGTGFIRATLSEKNGLLEMSMEDIYSTMQKHADYVLKAKLESITDELYKVYSQGSWGISYLGTANYQSREYEAKLHLKKQFEASEKEIQKLLKDE